MRRTADESLGRKPQEYADISRFSDDGFRQRGKQKIRVVNWGSNIMWLGSLRIQAVMSQLKLCLVLFYELFLQPVRTAAAAAALFLGQGIFMQINSQKNVKREANN